MGALHVDVAGRRTLWADRWDGTGEEAFAFEERVAAGVARAAEPTLREAEIDRVRAREPEALDAWELAMRALPGVLSYEAEAEERALELLERAIALAPQDPLPLAMAAWCHGVRSCSRRMREAVPWIERGLAEHPNSTWIKAFLAAGYALENRKEDARQALAAWRTIYPEVTVAQLASGLPFRAGLYDHLAEGLESVGMRAA